MKVIEEINQLKYPKEIRILPVRLHTESLDQLVILINRFLQEVETPSKHEAKDDRKKEFLIEVSVGAWRLKKKMVDTTTKQPHKEMGKVYRHLESIILTLEKEGVEIHDHDGQNFEAGLSLKVLAYQPIQNLESEYVLETIKPTIYLSGERILMGEVIVATFTK